MTDQVKLMTMTDVDMDLHSEGALKIEPQTTTFPAVSERGMLFYLNADGTNKLFCYDGSAWQGLW